MVSPILAQITDAIESAERLSRQDDRVLFLVTLILFFVAGGVAMRWFMLQLKQRDEELQAQRKENDEKIAKLYTELGSVRQQFNDYLIAVAKEMHSIVARNTDVIADNSKALQDNTEMSERKMSVLSRIEENIKVQNTDPVREVRRA